MSSGCIPSSWGAVCDSFIQICYKWTFTEHLLGVKIVLVLRFYLQKKTTFSAQEEVDIKTNNENSG